MTRSGRGTARAPELQGRQPRVAALFCRRYTIPEPEPQTPVTDARGQAIAFPNSLGWSQA